MEEYHMILLMIILSFVCDRSCHVFSFCFCFVFFKFDLQEFLVWFSFQGILYVASVEGYFRLFLQNNQQIWIEKRQNEKMLSSCRENILPSLAKRKLRGKKWKKKRKKMKERKLFNQSSDVMNSSMYKLSCFEVFYRTTILKFWKILRKQLWWNTKLVTLQVFIPRLH